MKSFLFICLSVILCGISISHAQDTTAVSDQEVIEQILESSSDEQDLLLLAEELDQYRQNPINLVTANYSDFIKLPFISPLLAEAIILFRDTVEFTSVDQLMNVSLFTPELYQKLLPFVTVESVSSIQSSTIFVPTKAESRSRLERRLQNQKGYSNNIYRGDANSSYQRLRIGNSQLEIAGLFEKDAGEIYGDGYSAGYISLRNSFGIKHVLVGNYTLSSGEGLVFSKNIATSKGSDAVRQTKKRGSTISPSVSTDEFRFFRGVASQVTSGDFTVLGFYSLRKLPASINTDGEVTSFYTSGIYQTNSDLNRRYALEERTLGGKIDYSFNKTSLISFNTFALEYDHPLRYTLYNLDGKKNIIATSASWHIPTSYGDFFGEAATNDGLRFSKIFGITLPLSRMFGVSYHHRAYTKGYVNPFAQPFGERSKISDGELGNYIGVEMRIPNGMISSYVDFYSLQGAFPEFGTEGRDLFFYMLYAPMKQLDVLFQTRNKIKQQINIRQTDDERNQTNYRLGYKYKLDRNFTIAQRFEIVNVSYYPSKYFEKGYLTFLEGAYKNNAFRFNIKSRFVFFDTQSYDSRLYQYESDVAGNFSNPPMYGKGMRWYLIGGYEIFNNLLLSVKYSETKKLNEVVLGSGNDEIQGNLDNYLVIQLDFSM